MPVWDVWLLLKVRTDAFGRVLCAQIRRGFDVLNGLPLSGDGGFAHGHFLTSHSSHQAMCGAIHDVRITPHAEEEDHSSVARHDSSYCGG